MPSTVKDEFDITYKVIVSREADPTAKVIFTMFPLGLDWEKVLLLSTYKEKARYTWEAGGELRGFKCDPEGSYIDEIEKPIHTTEITGSIYDMAAKTYLEQSVPLEGAVFQMRGPDKCDKVYSSTTDEEGMFRIGKVPDGTYKYLVSFNGFQTLTGNIMVSSRSEKIPIVFYMKIAQ